MELEPSCPPELPGTWLLDTPANYHGLSEEYESVSDRSLRKPAGHCRSRSLLGIHSFIHPTNTVPTLLQAFSPFSCNSDVK